LRSLYIRPGLFPVSRVAGRVGYDTPSAFVAAFRRETGQTPGALFKD
jgi:AraC-like DNA-binding protein